MKTERINGRLSIAIDGELGEIGFECYRTDDGKAVINVIDDWEGIGMVTDPAETIAALRAMLRELAGPSIDDVREAWGGPYAGTVHCETREEPWCACVDHPDPDGAMLYFYGDTEADALRAAYDAAPKREDA